MSCTTSNGYAVSCDSPYAYYNDAAANPVVAMFSNPLVLILWLACACVCGVLANRNGRSVGLAVVLGLVGGLIAVVCYAVAGAKKPAPVAPVAPVAPAREAYLG